MCTEEAGRFGKAGSPRHCTGDPIWQVWLSQNNGIAERGGMAGTTDGKSFRILTILDEYTRDCLAMRVVRHIGSPDAIDRLYELFLLRSVP